MKTRHFFKAFITLAVAGCVTTLSGLRLSAATIRWTNAASGNWSGTNNWSSHVALGAGDTAVITNAGVTVTLDISPTVGGIILGAYGPGTVMLAMNNQILSLNGPLTVNPSGSFTVDSGMLYGNTNAILGGTLNWSAGYLGGALTLSAGSTLNVTSANDHNIPNCVFTNNGTVAWSGGRIRGGAAGTQVYNNGLWDSQGDLTFNNEYGGSGTIVYNAGTFRKSASTGGNTIIAVGVLFNNTGKLDVQTNAVYLQGGGNFTGGTATNLLGSLVLNVGGFNINGTVCSTNVQINGGTLVGVNVLAGGLNWVVGDWSGGSTVTIPAGSVLLVTRTWDHNLPNVILTNNGTVSWSGGRIRGGSIPGTLIYNNGLWDSQGDLTFNNDHGGNGTIFCNAGTFRKSTGVSSNQTLISSGVLFNQLSGTVDVQTGNLSLQGGGNFTGGSVPNNSGILWLGSGNFNLNGTITGTNVIENAGNLIGTNIINGDLIWQAGTWQYASSVTIAADSAVLLAGGAGNLLMYNCLVTNYGTYVWSSGYPDGGGIPGTLVYNYGLWDCQSDYNFKNDGGGTLRKSAGSDASQTLLQSGVSITNMGKLDVQAGWLTLQGGYNLVAGTVNFGINSLTNYGKLNLPGAAPWSGAVSANLNNGYQPVTGNSFTNQQSIHQCRLRGCYRQRHAAIERHQHFHRRRPGSEPAAAVRCNWAAAPHTAPVVFHQ